MTNVGKPKLTLTEEMFSTFALRKNLKDQPGTDPGTSYEVFRNNTTAVEVVVKEVPNRDKKENNIPKDDKDKSLQEEIERYKNDLNKAKKSFQDAKNGFKMIIDEMSRIITETNEREINFNAKASALEIENEKLKTILENKCNLLNKFKTELNCMRKSLKYLLKCILINQKTSYNMSNDSDISYNEFEGNLKDGNKVKFAITDDHTFDSSMSKGTKVSFENN